MIYLMRNNLLLTIKDSILWNSYLNKIPNIRKDLYFTPEYYSLYQNYGDGEARCFVFEKEGNIAFYPFLKNPVTPLGYKLEKEYYDIQGAYGYNGLIVSTDNAEFIAEFWNEFDAWCQENNIVAEFMRFHPLLNNQCLASPKMKTFFSRHTVALDLSLSLDEIWTQQFSSKNRNMIRKAEKGGVTIVESNDYETFRKLYDSTMTNLNAENYYFFPQSYYDEYKVSFKDNSILCFAMLDGKVIAGSMFMFSEDYAHYHLSARDRNYSKYAANNLILWYGIQKAKERGCKWFHFGGGTTGDEGDSLLLFKQNFSKTKTEFWIGKRVHNQVVYDSVVQQWKENYPKSYEHNHVKLLGYREIDY